MLTRQGCWSKRRVRRTWPTTTAIRMRPVCSGRCSPQPALTASPSARAPAIGAGTARCNDQIDGLQADAVYRQQRLQPARAVRCTADDRQALEQLGRYITRSTLASERAQTNAAEEAVLKLKTPWRDGTTHMVISQLEFMQRVARPRPRSRMTTSQPSISAVGCPVWVGTASSKPVRAAFGLHRSTEFCRSCESSAEWSDLTGGAVTRAAKSPMSAIGGSGHRSIKTG